MRPETVRPPVARPSAAHSRLAGPTARGQRPYAGPRVAARYAADALRLAVLIGIAAAALALAVAGSRTVAASVDEQAIAGHAATPAASAAAPVRDAAMSDTPRTPAATVLPPLAVVPADAPVPPHCAPDAPQPDSAALRALYAGPVAGWPAPCLLPGAHWSELAPLPERPPLWPEDAAAPARIALGKRLFHDPRLSRSGQIACASCHEQDLGWADGRRVSFGHDRQPSLRHAPSVRYAAYAAPLFWDGRAPSLEAQALMPILHPAEMAFDRAGLETRLAGLDDYAETARQVYGRERLTMDDMARALADFQRSLAKPRGRYQAFLHGRREAFSDAQLRGLHVFRTAGGCMNCHSGAALTDNRFHNLGISFYGSRREDRGRYAVTGRPEDMGAFRTPALLAVGETAPYMHAGHFRDLRQVIAMYVAGMPQPPPRGAQVDDPLFPKQSTLLRPLPLSELQRGDLEAFLETL